jgi:dihydroorotate dehydrogenase
MARIVILYSLIRPFLFALDPEYAHELTLSLLNKTRQLGLGKIIVKSKMNPCQVMGLTFPNPIGLAAGLDKNGQYIDALAALGFGFIEIGTVTPRAQAGNPQPRLFRLPKARAIINRMGFNNQGVDTLIANVERSQFFQNKTGILGLNIGKNADTPIEKAADDYLYCLEKVYPYASYVTVNISSPNTKQLRQLQAGNELDDLLAKLKNAQCRLADQYKRYVPLALKIAPDLNAEQIKFIADSLLRHQIDAVIATNTTLSRNAVTGLKFSNEAGGLSGAPVFELSNTVIRALKTELGEAAPIIGVGGILSGAHAQAKITAGAQLVQIYSGLIYRGPALIRECAAYINGASS